MRFWGWSLLATFVGLLGAEGTKAAEIRGKVVEVIDGDSFLVADEDRRYEVWLQGIDAPDPGMPHSEEAKKALSDMILGRTVRVRPARFGTGGVLEATVFLDRRNVAERMLAEGWAWRYFRFAQRHTFSSAEASARAARKGLWADENPVPPWAYRADRGKEDFVVSEQAKAKEARLVQDVPPELTLDVERNRSRLFRAKRIINRLSVTASGVAEVVQFSPTEFEVIPIRTGETTLTVWFTNAQGEEASLRYLVRVNPEK